MPAAEPCTATSRWGSDVRELAVVDSGMQAAEEVISGGDGLRQ